MRSIEKALDFRPEKLLAVRRRIQSEHPSLTPIGEGEWSGYLADLKARVEEVSGNEERTERLALELTSKELTHIVSALGLWAELRLTICEIIRYRPKSRFLPTVWHVWQSFPHSREIESLLEDLASRFGWGRAVGADHAEPCAGWFRAENGLVGIVRWMATEEYSIEDLPSLPNSPFRKASALQHELFDTILTHGTKTQLLHINLEEILDGWGQLGPTERMVAGRNYLTRLFPGGWRRPCLEFLRHDYGMPGGENSIAKFWGPLSSQIRDAFRRFFIEKDLEKAFRRNTDRHRYWKKWAGQMVEVRLGEASGVDWALMDFGAFSVLEFFEVGNAAYFYKKKDLDSVPLRRNAQPSNLKMIIRRPVPGFSENRLIHQGHWEGNANEMVLAWQRNAG